MRPSSPLEARETSMTVLFLLQVMPSHLQQSVPPCHDLAKPTSFDSPARNCRRKAFSCSVQQLVGVAKQMNSKRARPRKGMGNLLLHFLYEKWSNCMASY
ncbi:hypothetical protein PVAP13_1KG052754 [Panicum virgatum]|uniref:Uncharacterized protein n=1 Tax=Panicum virgatum TaxID=38727 RepID=A0A8T0X9I2_PANVG|nr:hypothetical protein PVAP13_1KG052754 [Panicum virgatum]